MPIYESVIVIHPKLSDPEIGEFTDKLKKTISSGGGEILSEDKWGRRKLAYPISKTREGYYLYLKFNAEGGLVKKMGAQFRIQDDVLRALTVHAHEAKPNTKKPRVKAPAVRKEAEK